MLSSFDIFSFCGLSISLKALKMVNPRVIVIVHLEIINKLHSIF